MTSRMYLIGFMAAGKTTLGTLLSRRTGLPFVDTDTLIEQATGSSIADLFRSRGETHFRELEQQALRASAFLDTAIIATGGGLPAYDQNMVWMNAHGTTVYLQTDPQQLLDRLLQDHRDRPLLKGRSADEIGMFIDEKMAERSVYYHDAAHFIPSKDRSQALDALYALVRALNFPMLP
jgi:shikimate kinase